MPDIDKVVDGLGKHIDELIKPLVQALWDISYDTDMSCEGHIDWGRGYPCVDVVENKDMMPLIEALDAYNSQNPEVHWELQCYDMYYKTEILPRFKEKPEPHIFSAELKPETSNGFRAQMSRMESIPMHEEEMQKAKESIPLLAEFLRDYFS